MFRVHLAQAFVSLDGHAFLGNAHQDVQSAFKAVDVVFVVAFVEFRPFADHAFECGGGLGKGLVGFAVEELRLEVAHHHIAVQLACDFDELVSFMAFDTFERDFFFVQEAAQFGNGAVCAFCRAEVDRRSVQHGVQDEFVNDATFLLDDGFGQQELFGGIGKLFAFDGAAV